MSTNDRRFLRHTLAVLAYRSAKTIREAPESFGEYRADPNGNRPVDIIAHMADLIVWGLTLARGQFEYRYSPPTTWASECGRYFDALKALDDFLASDEPGAGELTTIVTGPVADALNHTGQLAMLRRMHGSPIGGENFTRADIVIGRVGSDQTPPDVKYVF
jgi:hypothetical protein